MATITDLNVYEKLYEKLGDGILHPVLQKNWILSFTGSKQVATPNDILKSQVTECKLDMKNKKALIIIEQSILGLEYYQFENINYDFFSMRIDAVNGNAQTYYSLIFSGCKILKHEHEFNYAKSAALYHELEVEYTSYDVCIPTLHEEVKPEPAIGETKHIKKITVPVNPKKHKKLKSPGVSVTIKD